MTTKATRTTKGNLKKLVYKKKLRNSKKDNHDQDESTTKVQKVSIVRRTNRRSEPKDNNSDNSLLNDSRKKKKNDHHQDERPSKLQKLSLIRHNIPNSETIPNESDNSIFNESTPNSIDSSNHNNEKEDPPIQIEQPPTVIHATTEQQTNTNHDQEHTSPQQTFEQIIESMLDHSNTKAYQKKVKRFVFDDLFQKVKFITSDLFLNGPVKNNVFKHVGLTEFPESVKQVWWAKYSNLVRKCLNQKRNNILGEFKKKFLGKSRVHPSIKILTIAQN